MANKKANRKKEIMTGLLYLGAVLGTIIFANRHKR